MGEPMADNIFVKKVEPSAFFSIGFSTEIGSNRLHLMFGTYTNDGPRCKVISSSKRCVFSSFSSSPSQSFSHSSATMASSVGECHQRMRSLHWRTAMRTAVRSLGKLIQPIPMQRRDHFSGVCQARSTRVEKDAPKQANSSRERSASRWERLLRHKNDELSQAPTDASWCYCNGLFGQCKPKFWEQICQTSNE